MKKAFTLIAVMLLLATHMFAQKLSYQAVIRNQNNELVFNATLTVDVTILGPNQNVLFSQTLQNVTSNQNGLISIQIGDDSPEWNAINWVGATIRSVIKNGTTTIATVNSPVSAVPLAIQSLNSNYQGNGQQVQANWEETDQNSPAFIKNKPTIPTAFDMSGYVTNEQLQNAGYLRYETQGLSDVAAHGNDAGSRQLKGLADPTDAQDAVTLSYLTAQLNALQQQLAQLSQLVASQQAVIDSLTNGGGGGEEPVTPTTFTCGDNLIDGNNSYTTHQYGSQCWMTQNLRNASGTGNLSYPDVLQACPTGWHLPSSDDWSTLGNHMSSLNNAPSLDFENGDYWTTTNSIMPWQDAEGNQFTLVVNWASIRTNNVNPNGANGIACEVNDILSCNCAPADYCVSVRCVREEAGGGSDTTGGPTTAQAPTVTNQEADLITENEATLFAQVSNPDNVNITSKGFEYKVSGSANYMTAECYVNSQYDGGFGIYAPLYNLTAGTEYTYRAFVTTAEGTSYGSEETFTTTAATPTPTPTTFTCGTSTIQDIDGNVYNTVQIGDQCWMKENMRTIHYADGTAIPAIVGYTSISASTTNPYYYDYDSSSIDLTERGLLYNWTAAMNNANLIDTNSIEVQGICPNGWHLPSFPEWEQLSEHVGSQSSYTCDNNNLYIAKALANTSGWNSSDNSCVVGYMQSSNNATGFSAVPAGCYMDGVFHHYGEETAFWSTTEIASDRAWARLLRYDSSYAISSNTFKWQFYSVRCLRN